MGKLRDKLIKKPLSEIVVLMGGDFHAEHSAKANNLKGYRQGCLVVDTLVQKVAEKKPDIVIINGDLFDEHGHLESSLAVEVQERFFEIAKNCVVIFVAGNHDYPSVKDQFFGKSTLTALFAGYQDNDIYVVDAKTFPKQNTLFTDFRAILTRCRR